MAEPVKMTLEFPPDPRAVDYPQRLNVYLERQIRLIHQEIEQLREQITP